MCVLPHLYAVFLGIFICRTPLKPKKRGRLIKKHCILQEIMIE